eukprot:g41193.t1
MVNARSHAGMYYIRVGATVLNKHVDHVKAENLEMVWEQNVPGSLTIFLTVPKHVGSLCPLSIEDTSGSEMDMAHVTASKPLPPEEENELLPRLSR